MQESPSKRSRGKLPKDQLVKQTRKQAKAKELDQIEKVSVFFPSEEEFADFMGYVIKCEALVKSEGIFKVSLILLIVKRLSHRHRGWRARAAIRI